MKISDFEKKLEKNPKYRKIRDSLERNGAFRFGLLVETARLERGISQEKLAKMIGTKQPAIARLESGRHYPNTGFLEKALTALGFDLVVSSVVSGNYQSQTVSVAFHNDVDISIAFTPM